MLHKGQVRTPTSNRPRASLTWSPRVEYAGRFVCRFGRTGGRTGERVVNGASDVFIANLGAVHDDTQVAVHFDDRERDYRQRLLRVRLVLPSGGDTPAHAGIWSAPFLADTLGDVVVKVQPNAHGPAVLLKAQVCCGRTGRQRSARKARASLTPRPPRPRSWPCARPSPGWPRRVHGRARAKWRARPSSRSSRLPRRPRRCGSITTVLSLLFFNRVVRTQRRSTQALWLRSSTWERGRGNGLPIPGKPCTRPRGASPARPGGRHRRFLMTAICPGEGAAGGGETLRRLQLRRRAWHQRAVCP